MALDSFKFSDYLFLLVGLAILGNLFFWTTDFGVSVWLSIKAVFFVAVILHIFNK